LYDETGVSEGIRRTVRLLGPGGGTRVIDDKVIVQVVPMIGRGPGVRAVVLQEVRVRIEDI
jgi:hypothetical protein